MPIWQQCPERWGDVPKVDSTWEPEVLAPLLPPQFLVPAQKEHLPRGAHEAPWKRHLSPPVGHPWHWFNGFQGGAWASSRNGMAQPGPGPVWLVYLASKGNPGRASVGSRKTPWANSRSRLGIPAAAHMNVPAFPTWENLTQLVAEGLPDGVVEGDGGRPQRGWQHLLVW